MVWWLFSRKKEVSKHPHIKKIESALKNSFSNIKTDINSVTSHITKHEDHISQIYKKLEHLEQNIGLIHNKLDSKLDLEFEDEFIEDKKVHIIDNLTTVQKSILLRLAHLQQESNEVWIPTKTLTEDLYPEKEYSQVRPMMSDYLNILSDFGLIKKVRKRRQTYVSLSKKALEFIPKNKQRKLIKLFEKHNKNF